MKKSSFVAMMLGTVSVVFFAFGMCMALLPEWDAFTEGVVFGAIGIIFGLITLIVHRKMEHKAPVRLNGRNIFLAIYGILGALILGTGMCLCMVWGKFVIGTIIGLVGILMLLSFIPILKGIR